jgi:hypothetical protein
LGIVVEGHGQVQVLCIVEDHAIRLIEVHGALPESVKAQGAQAVVVRDDDVMV